MRAAGVCIGSTIAAVARKLGSLGHPVAINYAGNAEAAAAVVAAIRMARRRRKVADAAVTG